MLPLSGFLPGGRSSLAPPQSDDPEYTPFHLKSQRYCRMAPMHSLHVKRKIRSKFSHIAVFALGSGARRNQWLFAMQKVCCCRRGIHPSLSLR
jgi:hypothetical protein